MELSEKEPVPAPPPKPLPEAPPPSYYDTLVHQDLMQDSRIITRPGAIALPADAPLGGTPPTGPTLAAAAAAAGVPAALMMRAAPPARSHQRSQSASSISSLNSKRGWFSFNSSSTTTPTPNTTTTTTSSFSSGASPAPAASHPSHASKKQAPATNEVRSTVLNLVRDLVKEHLSGSPAALGILQSCVDACLHYGVSLPQILQDKFVEGHSPLYWAVVKREQRPLLQRRGRGRTGRRSRGGGGRESDGAGVQGGVDDEGEEEESDDKDDEEDEPGLDLLDALLKHASPLNGDTVTELRLACLATSDQSMFQRLRLLPQFSSVSGADQILLGAALPPDDVSVELGSGTDGAFAVDFRLPQFHKRMMVSKEIRLEFIARNRIWRFSFLITPDNVWYGPPPGSWCIALSLQEPSPPTWLDARLVFPHHPDESESESESTTTTTTATTATSHLKVRSKTMLEAPRNEVPATQVVVALDESGEFGSLQYSGSPYVSADEKLHVRLEAKLRRPDPTAD